MHGQEWHEFAGLRRELEVALRLAPMAASAPAAAKSVAAYLDSEPGVPVRLAGLSVDSSRVLITIAVTLGSIDDIKVAGADSRAAVALLQHIVDDLAACDPAFVAVPDPASAEARLAAHVMSHPEQLSLVAAARRLAVVG